MRRFVVLVVVLVLVGGCGDDDGGADPGALDTCESVADAGIELLQDNLDFTDSMSEEEMVALWESGEMPEELQATQEAGEALEARATELGCSAEVMNALIVERADRLSADSDLGQMILEGIRAGEESFFGVSDSHDE